MEDEEKTEIAQEATALEESNPNFIQRFWYVFVLLAFVVILSLGILWAANQKLMIPKPTPTPVPTPTPFVEINTATSALEQQGTSDEITAIEADLEATNLSDIDKELTDIESELASP